MESVIARLIKKHLSAPDADGHRFWEGTNSNNPKSMFGKHPTLVRRTLFEMAYNGKSAGKQIVPSCGHPRCVEPSHCTAVTHSRPKINQPLFVAILPDKRLGPVKKNCFGTVLSDEMMAAITTLSLAGFSQHKIAAKIGCSQSTVSRFLRRQT